MSAALQGAKPQGAASQSAASPGAASQGATGTPVASQDAAPPYTIIRADCVLGEGPLWCERSQSLLWIDGSLPRILRWRWGAAEAEVWPQPRPPAALALDGAGRLFVAFRERFGVAPAPGEPVQPLAVPGLSLGDERFNDAKVDAAGRLWIGTIDRQFNRRIGSLRRFDADGIAVMAEGFALSNGMGWSPDGTQMYFSESFDRQVHRYRFDAAAGAITPDGRLAGYDGGEPKPDGLTVDAEGGIWCVVFGAGRIDRFWPDGRLDRSITLPVSRPTSCMFGGPDLRTLFVTTARYGLSPAELAAEPHAGSLFALPMPVAGRPEHRLAPDNLLVRAADALNLDPLTEHLHA
jgi:sugar lactone lactonase YvrE